MGKKRVDSNSWKHPENDLTFSLGAGSKNRINRRLLFNLLNKILLISQTRLGYVHELLMA